jgi:uncharacterized membrane protein SpoIIM required for sporulation
LTVLLARVGVAHFQREELLGRDIDVLNVRWAMKLFGSTFIGGAKNIKNWYGIIFKRDFRSLWLPILTMSALAVISVWIGTTQVGRFTFTLEQTALNDLPGRLQEMMNQWQIGDFGPVLAIFLQNSRTVIIAMLLGFLSLGVLGSIPMVLTLSVVGYLMELLRMNSMSPWTYAIFVLPHGVIEVPALIIATASVLRAGALMATPNLQKTVGEVWIGSIAEWSRVIVGVVLPLLFLAAMIEAWVTPRIAFLLVK